MGTSARQSGAFQYGVDAYQRSQYTQALKWFRLSAAQGSAAARFNFGLMHALGQGVEQDYAEAAKWFRLAASQGNADAQCAIGVMYINGFDVARDEADAKRWFLLAAAQGNKDAQLYLDSMYSTEQFVETAEEERENLDDQTETNFKRNFGQIAEQDSGTTTIRGVAMNTRQRRILIAVGMVILGMMLYPPFYYPRDPDSRTPVSHGYGWLLGYGEGRVEVDLLLTQFLVVGVVGLIGYILFTDKRQ